MTPEVRLICPHGLKTLGKYIGTFVNPSKEEDPNAVANFLQFKHGKGWQKTKPVTEVKFPYNGINNLPCVMGRVHDNFKYAFCASTEGVDSTADLKRVVCVTEQANTNLTAAQKELLRWHYCLGHIGLKHVQWLVRQGKLKVRGKPSSVANCDLPQCASCNFGKAQRCSSKAKMTILNKDKENEIKKQHLLPGQKVSADSMCLLFLEGCTPPEGVKAPRINFVVGLFLLIMLVVTLMSSISLL